MVLRIGSHVPDVPNIVALHRVLHNICEIRADYCSEVWVIEERNHNGGCGSSTNTTTPGSTATATTRDANRDEL